MYDSTFDHFDALIIESVTPLFLLGMGQVSGSTTSLNLGAECTRVLVLLPRRSLYPAPAPFNASPLSPNASHSFAAKILTQPPPNR